MNLEEPKRPPSCITILLSLLVLSVVVIVIVLQFNMMSIAVNRDPANINVTEKPSGTFILTAPSGQDFKVDYTTKNNVVSFTYEKVEIAIEGHFPSHMSLGDEIVFHDRTRWTLKLINGDLIFINAEHSPPT